MQRDRAECTVSKWSEYLELWKEIKSVQQSEATPDIFLNNKWNLGLSIVSKSFVNNFHRAGISLPWTEFE